MLFAITSTFSCWADIPVAAMASALMSVDIAHGIVDRADGIAGLGEDALILLVIGAQPPQLPIQESNADAGRNDGDEKHAVNEIGYHPGTPVRD